MSATTFASSNVDDPKYITDFKVVTSKTVRVHFIDSLKAYFTLVNTDLISEATTSSTYCPTIVTVYVGYS